MAKNPLDTLLDYLDLKNIAEELDETRKGEIAGLVKRGYELDDSSRSDWKEQTEEGIKIAEQIMEKKTYPWAGASNVKFPLIAISAIQFAARAYPSIIQGHNVVKGEVIGKDPDNRKAEKARRISTHMSWQLLEKMQGWDEDVDKMLHTLPVVGTVFKKTYYDELNQTNASELCMPLDVVVHTKTTNLQKCRRITHIVNYYRNEVLEKERAGLFLEKEADYFINDSDEDMAECFLEQHRWLDLDGDGYEEPYIVTVHEASDTLVRIVACYDSTGIKVNDKGKIVKIDPVKYFTDFHFIPASSGKFYSLGFAHLLGGINETLSTVINQLIDSGHMAIGGGGFFGKGIRIRAGDLRFKPFEWKQVEIPGGVLKDNIVPLPVREPSNVLFQLLGLLNDVGMKLASVSDAMAGETPSQNTPATTTLAVIEQGLKVFTAIYKRIFRSLKSEYSKLRRLNSIYLDSEEVFRVLDEEQIAFKEDYNLGEYDIVPVADPNMASDAQRLAKAQALMGTMQLNPTPEGRLEILQQYYDAIQAPNIDKLLPKDDQGQIKTQQPPPDPKAIELQLKAVESQTKAKFEHERHPLELVKLQAEIDEIKSRTEMNLANAASKPLMDQLAALNASVAAMHNETKMEIERMRHKTQEKGVTDGSSGNSGGDSAGGVEGMGAPPDNTEGTGLPVQMPEGVGGGSPVGTNDELQQLGGNSLENSSPAIGDQGVEPAPAIVE
jgi:chaperonin GroES